MTVKNIVLVGFMGTGKTTVGRALAERIGWNFVDMDARIEEKEGMKISEIFAAKGEADFRLAETEVLRELLQGEGLVVSTGGGAVLKEENRSLMAEGGLVVALQATRDTIISRIGGDRNRPLLAGNAAERVDRLMAERRDAYDFAGFFVETDQMTVDEAVETIAKAAGLAIEE